MLIVLPEASFEILIRFFFFLFSIAGFALLQCFKGSCFEKIPRAEHFGSAQDNPPVPGFTRTAPLFPSTLCAFSFRTSGLSERFHKVSSS